MYGRIDRDYLFEPGDTIPSRVGTTWGKKEQAEGEIFRIRLLDDDGEVYYGGESDDEAMETIYEFARRDAGAVILEAHSEGETEWKMIIG